MFMASISWHINVVFILHHEKIQVFLYLEVEYSIQNRDLLHRINVSDSLTKVNRHMTKEEANVKEHFDQRKGKKTPVINNETALTKIELENND